MPRLDAKWLDFTARGQTWDHFWQDAASAAVETTFCDYDYAADTYDNASDTYDCGTATTPARRNDSDGPGFEDDDIELIVVALRRRLRF